jgi:hypothetical protein
MGNPAGMRKKLREKRRKREERRLALRAIKSASNTPTTAEKAQPEKSN